MLSYTTAGYKGFSVKYSPFFDNRLAVATGQHYGLAGNGRIYVLGLSPRGILCERWWASPDVVYDLAWSEGHNNHLITAAGDGTLRLFDFSVPNFPIQSWAAHAGDAYCVNWNTISKDTFLSAGQEGNVKVFHVEREEPIVVLPTHSCTYSAHFKPHENGIITAVSSDSIGRVFDLRTPSDANNHLVNAFPIHTLPQAAPGRPPNRPVTPSECLTHDWNKYHHNIIATGSTDRLIRMFDMRNTTLGPIDCLSGHSLVPRRVAWSPHPNGLLISASYDMTCRVWSAEPGTHASGNVGVMNWHTEFALGVDWSLFGTQSYVASCGWDEKVHIWDVRDAQV